jgi:Ni,Fe-hydrogenase III large subunit
VVRAFALELERVAMHLATLAGIAADIGFSQGAATYGRLRTTAINTMMQLCGSRFGRGALRPGAVRIRLADELLARVQENVALIAHDIALINELFLSSRIVQNRLRSVGILSRAHAEALGIVGLAARASGIERDTRSGSERGAYAMVPLSPVSMQSGDCWARTCVRTAEIDASLSWLSRAVEHFPAWEAQRSNVGEPAPRQLAIAIAEGFRGEVVHVVETGEAGQVLRYKVQDPSFRNWMGLAVAMRGGEISDFPICNKSFDLSYCGHDL